ncbi:response regulator [Falsirhodobacter sp. alg1]|uniref:response regulator n=1 Tax=Falsirhodobacter sp. alg1 TaxID=1472418 RepID=UPI0005F008DD|nr:response regulator [Falsirhodobacter sp. alg1]
MTSIPKSPPAVLVVEDEPLIRMEAVDMIEDAGFSTYSAKSADAAITILESHDDIGILFTDVDMPGSMDGLKLAAYVQGRWPAVGIIVASGIVNANDRNLPEGVAFFPKPYPTSRIIEALGDIAARQPE